MCGLGVELGDMMMIQYCSKLCSLNERVTTGAEVSRSMAMNTCFCSCLHNDAQQLNTLQSLLGEICAGGVIKSGTLARLHLAIFSCSAESRLPEAALLDCAAAAVHFAAFQRESETGISSVSHPKSFWALGTEFGHFRNQDRNCKHNRPIVVGM